MAPQDVKASLNYALDEGRAHFRFGYDEEGQERSGGNVVAKEVLVNDGRGADIKFKTHGFELVDFPTTFEKEDFYGDRSKILADYYREMEECIKRHTGAEIVKCFNYIVRNPVKFDPDADNHFVKDYANGIHTDTGPEGARALFSCLSEDLDERFQRGRFVYINAWRNISDDPIEDYNLAILDPNSLKGSEDFIDNEYYGYDPEHDFKFKEKTFVLNQRNNADHRWFYFPRMTKNEVLIFKQWDSDPSAPTRTCFHTSFSRADGADAAVPPLRESIDVRALAFFPGSESSLDLHEEEKESEKRENPKFLTEGRTEDFLAYRCGSFTVAGGNLVYATPPRSFPMTSTDNGNAPSPEAVRSDDSPLSKDAALSDQSVLSNDAAPSSDAAPSDAAPSDAAPSDAALVPDAATTNDAVPSDDVVATLNYSVNDGVPIFYYGYPRQGTDAGKPQFGGTIVPKEVTIKDARAHPMEFDENSFTMVDFPTALKTEDFYGDRAKVEEIYYPEIEECIKRHTGAAFVKCFNYQVRNREKFDPDAKNLVVPFQDYALGIHSDTSKKSAEFLWAILCTELEERFHRGRFVYMNAWRNISDEPIVNHHLAMLDQKSLTPGIGSEDYVDSEYHGYEQKGDFTFTEKTYALNEKNSHAHRWFYYPRARKDEVILFKQFDSDPERPARMCFHTAFEDPKVDPKAPPRQSIEVRAYAFFPDHVPDSCPGKGYLSIVKAILWMSDIKKRIVSVFTRS